MKKTHRERRAFLDRLEKKYIKKVQLQAFKRESELVKRSLTSIQGASVRNLRQGDIELPDASYKLHYL